MESIAHNYCSLLRNSFFTFIKIWPEGVVGIVFYYIRRLQIMGLWLSGQRLEQLKKDHGLPIPGHDNIHAAKYINGILGAACLAAVFQSKLRS